MKKESTIVKEKNIYDLRILIRNTALMQSITGTSGLVNVKSNEIVGSFDNFYTIYDNDNNFYFQEKEIPHESGDYFRRKKSVRIYDALNEKTVADNWLVIKQIDGYYHLAIIQNPTTGKYHLFNESAYRKASNPFEEEYDDIKYLFEDYDSGKNFAFTKNGKVGIYSTKKGLITPIKYDNIEHIGDITIFTEGKYKFFTGIADTKDNEVKSPLFEDIIVDEKNSHIFYCKRNSMIAIYYLKKYHCKLMFTTSIHDEISCINTYEEDRSTKTEYKFLVKDGEKYGLIYGVDDRSEENETSCKKIADVVYDEISYKDRNYFLKRDNKVGLFKGNYKKSYTIGCRYDNIVEIDYNYYELFNGEFCDIINLDSPNNPLITNCKVIKNLGGDVIFEKNGKKGIVMISRNGTKIFKDYDEVEYLGGMYYKIQKNGKVGIIFGEDIIIEPAYKDINLHGDSDFETLKYSNVMYFALQKDNSKYELAKLTKGKYSWDESKIEFLNGGSYNSIELYNDIMVFRDDNNAHVFNYKEVPLKTFPANVEIVPTTVKRGKDKISLYCVNGLYFFYRNDKFEEAFMEECDLYVTTYESDYGTVVVNSYDKSKHDEVCRQIEEGGEENFDKTLCAIYEKNPSIKEKYPTLVKKIK